MVPGKTSFARYQVLLKPNGLCLAGAGGLKEFIQMAWTSLTGGKKAMALMAPPDRKADDDVLRIYFSGEKAKALAGMNPNQKDGLLRQRFSQS